MSLAAHLTQARERALMAHASETGYHAGWAAGTDEATRAAATAAKKAYMRGIAHAAGLLSLLALAITITHAMQ